jgi:hypothetical protein
MIKHINYLLFPIKEYYTHKVVVKKFQIKSRSVVDFEDDTGYCMALRQGQKFPGTLLAE